jgi:hypothetical protein
MHAKAKSLGNEFYLAKDRSRCPGGGRQPKWSDLEDFIVQKVQQAWETGMPLCTEELMMQFQVHVHDLKDPLRTQLFVNGKKNTADKFISHVLKRNQYSIRKNSILQSVPVDWRQKSEENTLRIRTLFKDENVDVVVNADENFVLFHMQDGHLIVPTGTKRVGSAAQVDNKKVGATVIIGCEFRTSSILPPLIFFTGVYGAK